MKGIEASFSAGLALEKELRHVEEREQGEKDEESSHKQDAPDAVGLLTVTLQ